MGSLVKLFLVKVNEFTLKEPTLLELVRASLKVLYVSWAKYCFSRFMVPLTMVDPASRDLKVMKPV